MCGKLGEFVRQMGRGLILSRFCWRALCRLWEATFCRRLFEFVGLVQPGAEWMLRALL